MENMIGENDMEEFYKRFMFLKKYWLKFLVFQLVKKR